MRLWLSAHATELMVVLGIGTMWIMLAVLGI